MKNTILLITVMVLASCSTTVEVSESEKYSKAGMSCNNRLIVNAVYLKESVIREAVLIKSKDHLENKEEAKVRMDNTLLDYKTDKTCFTVTLYSKAGSDAASFRSWIFKARNSDGLVLLANPKTINSPKHQFSNLGNSVWDNEAIICTNRDIDNGKKIWLHAIPQLDCSEPIILTWKF